MAGTRIRLAALAAACLLPLTACGGVVSSRNDSDEFITMGFGTEDALGQSRLADARKALAPMDVQANEGGFDAQQFLSAVAAGDPPDVVRMDRQLIGGFANRGALMPLTDCVEREHIDTADYRRAILAETTLDGVQYSLPDSNDSRMLMINGKALKQAGLTPSDLDTADWKKLSAATKKLTGKSGGTLTRIGFNPKIPEFFPLWVKANGGSLISADGKKAELDSPEVVEALEYTLGLIKAQGGWGRLKSLNDSFDFFGAKNEYASDQLGAMPMEDWYFNVLALNSPDIDLETAPFHDREGHDLNYTSGLGWAIPKGSRHPEQACAFIKTVTSTASWVRAAKAKAAGTRKDGKPYTGDTTGNIKADAIIQKKVWKPTGKRAFDDATRAVYQAQDDAFVMPANPAGDEFRTAWQKAVNRALGGQQTPRDALAQGQREAQRALDLANEGNR